MEEIISSRSAAGFTLVVPSLIPAQVDYSTATLKGTVFDSQGLVVTGARVSVHPPDTGWTKVMQTAADGSYRFASLTPGNYKLQGSSRFRYRARGRRGLQGRNVAWSRERNGTGLRFENRYTDCNRVICQPVATRAALLLASEGTVKAEYGT